MPTVGSTARPTDSWEWGTGTAITQSATALVMPEKGDVVRLGGWLRGYSVSTAFRLCLWDSSGNLLRQSASFTSSAAAVNVNNLINYEEDITAVEIADGATVYVGFFRSPSGGHQTGLRTPGTHRDDGGSSTSPYDFAGYTNHGSGTLGFYLEYESAHEVFVRRGGVWVPAERIAVRRGAAWVDAEQVSVRRGGVWEDA